MIQNKLEKMQNRKNNIDLSKFRTVHNKSIIKTAIEQQPVELELRDIFL